MAGIKNHASENREIENTMSAMTPRTRNLYNKMEWAGAFGDVGTLIPMWNIGAAFLAGVILDYALV